MKIAVVAAILSNILVSTVLFDSQFLLAESLLNVVLAGLCLFIALKLVAKPERFLQSFAAYCGVSSVVNVATVLLLAPAKISNAAGEGGVVLRFLEILLLVWSLAVVGHIIRHTFSVSTPASIIFAICYLLLYIQIAAVVLGI